LRNDQRRITLSQIQADTSSSSSSALGSSLSSSTAIQNVNNLLNDEDEGNSFSDDSLERSFTRSPVKEKPLETQKQPPKSTLEDHEFIMQNCAEQNMTPERINAKKGDDTMYLFTTNADNNTHNMNQIQKINEKICLLQTEHDSKSSKSRSTEGARKLASKLYVSKRSRVMLLWNVSISLGLVNGSTGYVVRFSYKEGHKAPDLPYSIIIHFDDYKGPPFFTIYGCKQYKNTSVDPLIKEWVLISPPDKREKWVPILVSEYKWSKSVNDENPSRKNMFSLGFNCMRKSRNDYQGIC
jgi:hypothetical protein